jgi:hypothetical protein
MAEAVFLTFSISVSSHWLNRSCFLAIGSLGYDATALNRFCTLEGGGLNTQILVIRIFNPPELVARAAKSATLISQCVSTHKFPSFFRPPTLIVDGQ